MTAVTSAAPPPLPIRYQTQNGDVLPTFLINGRVAGLWSTETVGSRVTLRIDPFTRVPAKQRAALTSEAEHLMEYLAPDAEVREVIWRT